MQIWPAIDILGGRCVRLQQGDYQRETVFGEDPLAMAGHWVEQGAECLHLVDLDGARDGHIVNREVIRDIVQAVPVPCELGGGVRDEETIAAWLELGLDRLVVGTRALQDADWFRRMVRQYPRRLVLGIDARDGRVATEGWLQTSNVSAVELARSMTDEPLAAIVYTDISRDGMLAGPNFDSMAAMREAVACPLVASGGVTELEDIVRLARLGMEGCIIGRALYEGQLSLPAALAAVRDRRLPAGGASRSD
jgi:phosphoribosylformimino-5-aminoimidazole carboxamide ribotide isomerase